MIHIGGDKTGTSSIQRTFVSSAAALAANHFHYPAAGRTIGGTTYSRQIGLRFAMSPFEQRAKGMQSMLGLIDADDRRRYRKEFESRFDAEISALPDDATVLISDEALFLFADRQTVENCAAFLDRRFSEVSVVCYLRRPDALMPSRYSHHVKTGGTLPLADYVKKRAGKNLYFPILKMWSDAFGRDRITIRPFDLQRLVDGDVVSDFCGLIDLDVNKLSVVTTNRSLTPLGSSLLRQINLIPKPRPVSAVIRRGFEALFTGKGTTLPLPLRKIVYDAWRQDHAQVVDYFMARSEAEFYCLDGMLGPGGRDAPRQSAAASAFQSVRINPRP